MSNWKGRKVLITGAEGFIGSHLVERLLAAGADVRAFVWYNSFSRWGWLEPPEVPREILQSVEIFPGDIRDPRRVREAVAGCDTVFHLCSLIAIPFSYVAPDSYVQTNVTGALNVLNACRDEGGVRLVHTSTSEVYGSARRVPIDETHPLQGQSPYSASKIGADMLAESFHRSFGLQVATVRPFNTYGPRQSARAVIPTILAQVHSGATRIRLGALHPTRDFTYVADTVEGMVRVAECEGAVGRVVNVGSGHEIAIGDLVRLILDVTGREADVTVETDRVRPPASEVDRLCCDRSVARDMVGWEPVVGLREGIERTSRWVAANLQFFKPDVYNR